MSTYDGASSVMGSYLPEHVEEAEDFWEALGTYVADIAPWRLRLTAAAIDGWMRQAPDDDALQRLYWRRGGRYRPDPNQWSLRECLTQVVRYLEQRSQEAVPAPPAEFDGLPADLVVATLKRSGRYGQQWLRAVPGHLEWAIQAWGLEVAETFRSTSHLVAGVTRGDGTAAVLRIGQPGGDFGAALSTLELYDGLGAVRLLESDFERGAALVERALPGDSLASLVATDDETATTVAVGLLQTLWHPSPDPGIELDSTEYEGPFPFVAWIREDFDAYEGTWADQGPIRQSLVSDAHRILHELLASAPEAPTILHGDLHHDNIVSSDRAPGGWLAIDPKGWVGDPGYDVGALLYNPLGYVADVADLSGLLDRRLRQLSEQLGMDEDRLRAWGFVKAVAAEAWFVQDDGATHGVPLRVAETLRSSL